MPNLFSALPVAIFLWVRASTSGLTRSATRARLPRSRARRSSSSSSGRDSTLNCWMSASSPATISPARLADPGEDDALGRDAGRQRPAQLALRDDIGAGTEPREGGDHRLVGIGLQRIADGGARAVEGADEGLIALDQGGRWNSNRTGFRRPQPAGRAAPLRHEGCRPDRENNSLIHGLVGVRGVCRICRGRRRGGGRCRGCRCPRRRLGRGILMGKLCRASAGRARH